MSENATKPKGFTSVMNQRVEPADSLDPFFTPPWATRALCEWLKDHQLIEAMSVWEPACGPGHMARPLTEYFREVHATDVHDYGASHETVDFLLPSDRTADFVITNPPFKLAEEFACLGLARAKRGVALLVRTSFLESTGRYARLYTTSPPTDILQFTERVPMVKGRLDKSATTATSYAWLTWLKGSPAHVTRFHWLAPCRKRLEKEGDYS